MSKRRRWIIYLTAVGFAGLIAGWASLSLWQQQFQLQRYTSPPIDSKGTRVSVLAPEGWEARLEQRQLPPKESYTRVASPQYVYSVRQVHRPNRLLSWLEQRFPSAFAQDLYKIEASGVGVRVEIYAHGTKGMRPLPNELTGKEVLFPEPNWERAYDQPVVYFWLSMRRVDSLGYDAVAFYGYHDKAKFDRLHKEIAESVRILCPQ